jgi:5-methylcytosine-specific restriction enzyme subunit McrC
MGALFEAFVRNFLKHEQDQFQVSRDKVRWNVTADAAALKWLPEMQLDVLLSSAAGRMVIETKFYAQPFQERYDTQKLRSDHLYQLLTYLRHLGACPGPQPSGLLLYAGAAQPIELRYEVAGVTVRVETLDLDQPWPMIRRDLLAMVADRQE